MLQGWLQIALFLAVLIALTPLSAATWRASSRGERVFLLAGRSGRSSALTYRVLRVDPTRGQDWKAYARSAARLLAALLARALPDPAHPGHPPVQPARASTPAPGTSASTPPPRSSPTPTGSTTAARRRSRYFAQMAGLAVQNFVSAAVGIAVVVALIRGIVAPQRARASATSGRTWSGRSSTSCCRSRSSARSVLVSQGVIQNLADYADGPHARRRHADPRARARSPRRRSIKELGTNGGGFFNVNSAYPVREPERPHQLRRAAADPDHPGRPHLHLRAHGRQPAPGLGDLRGDVRPVRRRRRRRLRRRAARHPGAARSPASHTHAFDGSTGGNMEGKEQRFGIADSSLWTAVTTVTSCGAVNAAFESLTGIGGAVPFANLGDQRGRLRRRRLRPLLDAALVLLAVFIGGLMVGRTPEYLGKKIEAREIKLVSLGVAVHAAGGAVRHRARRSATQPARASIYAGGPAGLLRDPLRLPLAGQQQRLRLRRLHRLRPAQRARQRRRLRRHASPTCSAALAMVVRPLRADPLRARRRRLAGRQEGRAGRARARCAPTRRPSSSC